MALTGEQAYALSKKYTSDSIAGAGAVAGKPCQIDSVTPITGGNRVTFLWEDNAGTSHTSTMDVMDGAKGDKGDTGDTGKGIKAVIVNAEDHLIVTYTDDTTTDAGQIQITAAVDSVNGKTGTVVLTASDVGALPDDTELFSGDYNDLDNLPDLTNFITNTVDNLVNYYKKTETYTKAEVDNIANTIKNGRFEVVATLPTTDIKTNVIYLVPKSTTQTDNVKDEYINLDGTSAGWEKIGDTEIDLSGYVTTTALNTALADYTTTTDLTALLAGKVDKVTGKGLSTNDYTNTDKELVDSVPNLAPISLVKDTVGWTGKNLLKNEASTLTTNGITWTVNDDGTILINGTNTDNSYLTVNNMNISLDVDTEYILSGNTTENADEWYLSLFLQVGYEGMTNYQYIFNNNPTGVKFKLRDLIGESNLTSLRCYARVGIRHEAQTVDNVTFYPMIRRADILDDIYEPYHESVETMYEEEIHGVNLLKNTATTQTVNGVTFTVNADGSVTANGTATSDATIRLLDTRNQGKSLYKGQTVILSKGSSSMVANTNMWMNCYDGNTFLRTLGSAQGILASESNPFTIDYSDYDGLSVGITISTGVTVSNTVFKPMLRKATIEDSTYRPYNPQAIQNQINAQEVLGAKNLLPQVEHANTTMAINGVTITSQEDGSVLLNGTSTAAVPYHFIRLSSDADRKFIKQVAGKKVTISGTNVSNTGAKVQFWSSATNVIADTTGKGTTFTIPSDLATTGDYNFAIYIPSGVTLNNVIVYPMLRLASDPDDTYQPYAMTNRELTEKILEKKVLTSADDLNDVIETGLYAIRDGIPTNSPENTNWCSLLVNNVSDNNVQQQLFKGEYLYQRKYSGVSPVWGSWYKFTGTVVS